MKRRQRLLRTSLDEAIAKKIIPFIYCPKLSLMLLYFFCYISFDVHRRTFSLTGNTCRRRGFDRRRERNGRRLGLNMRSTQFPNKLKNTKNVFLLNYTEVTLGLPQISTTDADGFWSSLSDPAPESESRSEFDIKI